MSSSDVRTIAFRRGKLPHWLVADRSYFVTICRKGCLPGTVVEELRREREEMRGRQGAASLPPEEGCRARSARPTVGQALRACHPDDAEVPAAGSDGCRRGQSGRDASDVGLIAPDLQGQNAGPVVRGSLWAERFRRVESILDAVEGGCRDLIEGGAARIVLDNLAWLRGRGWRIWAATVMPSHVHMVLRHVEEANEALAADLGQFKNYTGRLANAQRGASGAFWQRENFDHWCRDEMKWIGAVQYTVRNPEAAGLVSHWRDWPWSVVDDEVAEAVGETDAVDFF